MDLLLNIYIFYYFFYGEDSRGDMGEGRFAGMGWDGVGWGRGWSWDGLWVETGGDLVGNLWRDVGIIK